jgi:adenosine deaminase
MAEEYALLIHKFDFKRPEIKKLILNAVQSSWRPEKIGPSLIEKFKNNKSWVEM